MRSQGPRLSKEQSLYLQNLWDKCQIVALDEMTPRIAALAQEVADEGRMDLTLMREWLIEDTPIDARVRTVLKRAEHKIQQAAEPTEADLEHIQKHELYGRF